MVGSALLRQCENYIPLVIDKKNLDLRNQQQVEDFFQKNNPDKVVICASKVGGIKANNTYPAEFIYDNIMIQSNIINSAYKNGVKRLLFLGSTCIYPKFAPQPMKEDCLLTGALEPTNEAYAIAKISGIKMCEFYSKQYGVTYHSVMPTNLFGINDNYHPENSHVIPGLIRKIYEAKQKGDSVYQIWGTGTPKREFLFADDLASICYKLLKIDNPPHLINAGSNTEMTILELTKIICKIIGYKGKIICGANELDGTPRKKTDLTKLNKFFSFEEVPFEDALKITYQDFLNKKI